jgi:hypothetical protein
MMNMKDWLEAKKHLPPFMRDFHDQKDLFKFIQSVYEESDLIPVATHASWIDLHIYTIDFFLWMLARRGWTLQRSRQKLPFKDIETDVQEYLEKYRSMFKNSPID